ncbi:MAG: 1-acyl-sn-glycerol-3-phosphate acyltransferase [Saprospiraceae bacterium]|jgi:glycerol-3-phosphate O-acyltransferase|nr:1-acyl-sn-glycerol-3-phosphate acyltransferase [Saprospiraceae bacterium]
MTHIYPHIIPKIEDWPINRFARERKEFIDQLNDFVFDRILRNSSQGLEDILAKTIYLESQRIKSNPWKVDPTDDAEFWRTMANSLTEALKSSDKEAHLKDMLRRIVHRYNEEIVGNFNPSTFRFARKFLTVFFKRIFNRFKAPGQRWFWGNKNDLLNKIKLRGYVDETRSLFTKGTVVIVPTHFSNLDSITIGYALDMVGGMPALSYGAGLNLFEVEIVAYFINRLGAYKVDRRKKNPVYLECLTSMASYALYKGVPNIFFPGGTRSRSGALENKLKYGLLGSAIEAQRLMMENGKQDKIYIVPLVISYNFVLEAKSLIEQHLMAIGKEKYQRSRESKNIGSKWNYFKLFFSKQSEMVLSFGEPMDVLGNRVDEEGHSLDKNCNPLSLREYFMLEGELAESAQRESVYTRILAEKVLDSYFRNNVVLSSHLVAFVAFRMLLNQRKDLSLFAILRLNASEFSINADDFTRQLEILVDHMKTMEVEGKLRLSDEIFKPIDQLILHGIEMLGSYHIEKVLGLDDQRKLLFTQHIKLLYFYANRLEGYDFETQVPWIPTEKFRYVDKLKED